MSLSIKLDKLEFPSGQTRKLTVSGAFGPVHLTTTATSVDPTPVPGNGTHDITLKGAGPRILTARQGAAHDHVGFVLT